MRRLCALLDGEETAGVRHRTLQDAPARAEARPGFVAIHHAAADQERYRPLAEALGEDHPFATLQLEHRPERWPPAFGKRRCKAEDLESRVPPRDDTLERLAGAYRDVIASAQPQGPIRLVGFCRSGVLAFETARQLAQAGREVALVVLIDCWEPGYFRRLAPRARLCARAAYRRGRLATLARHIRREGTGYIVSRIGLRLRSNRAWRRLLRVLHRTGINPPNPEEAFWQVTDDLDALALAYDPGAYAGPVLIVRSQSIPVAAALDPTLGWRDHAARIETLSVPGFGHEGAFSPDGCRVMAAKINLMACR